MKNKQIRIAAWKMYICNPNPNPDPNTKIQFVLDKNICLALQRVKSRFFFFFYTFGPGSTILFFSCLRPGCDVCVKLAGNALAAIQRFNSCMLIFMF